MPTLVCGMTSKSVSADDDKERAQAARRFNAYQLVQALHTDQDQDISDMKDEDVDYAEALLFAARLGYAEIVAVLLSAGVKANATNSAGATALMQAVEYGWAGDAGMVDAANWFNVVNALVSWPGVDLDRRNKKGETALKITERLVRRHPELMEGVRDIVAVLRAAGAQR